MCLSIRHVQVNNFLNYKINIEFSPYQYKVYATPEYLMKFFGNLLLGDNNELKNRHLRIDTSKDIVEEQTEALKENKGGQKTDSGGLEVREDFKTNI